MEGVDLAVCNYHHLLDPGIRAQFFRWLGRDPEDVVVVFDEAHNIEDAARDHAAQTLTENTLDSALSELEEVTQDRAAAAERVVSAFRDALVETYEESFGPGGQGPPARSRRSGRTGRTSRSRTRTAGTTSLSPSSSSTPDRASTRTSTTRSRSGSTSRRSTRRPTATARPPPRRDCHVLQVAEFVETYVEDGGELGQYPTAAVRRDEGTEAVYGRAELYTCIPREVTTTLFDAVHASVLMSATLRPFDVVGDVLGLEDPVEMAFGLQFPAERRRTFAVDTEPLFASKRDDRSVQREVADVLRDAVRFTPGNCLFFFPSYAEAERYHDLLSDVDAARYLDEPGVAAEELRQSFVADRNGALFTSLWGRSRRA